MTLKKTQFPVALFSLLGVLAVMSAFCLGMCLLEESKIAQEQISLDDSAALTVALSDSEVTIKVIKKISQLFASLR